MKIEVEHKFIYHKSYFNPWFIPMAIALWNENKGVIYPNENNVLVKRFNTGITILVKTDHRVKEKPFDKRYDEPFEDDGAYAD
jgi:hypothetical protein